MLNEIDKQDKPEIQVITVDNFDELSHFESQWNQLIMRCPSATPMSTFAWIYAYLKHFVIPPGSWMCLLAMQDNILLGVLPLVQSSSQSISLPNNLHTISVDMILEPKAEGEVYQALLNAIQLLDIQPSIIKFHRIREDSPTQTLQTQELFQIIEPAGKGSYLPIPSDFNKYRSSLSRNFRNNLNKAANKLKNLPNVKISILSGCDADPLMLSRFADVEVASWKGETKTAIQCSPILLDFYSDLVKYLFKAGWLEWHFLESDGRPIAANLCIRLKQSLFIWKLGYDSQYSQYSPGSLLLENVIYQASVNHTIDEIDLMTNEPWYKNWHMSSRSYINITGYWKNTSCGITAYYSMLMKKKLRRSPLLRLIKQHFLKNKA